MDRRRAVIVDVDGTLTEYSADRENRARDSKPRPEICDVVWSLFLSGYDPVFVSARPPHQWRDTYDWISEHVFDGLITVLRDWVIVRDDETASLSDVQWKRLVYLTEIAPTWDVSLAIDDMERSVQVWRDLGLTVLQVRADHAREEES